jgi:hypothetical protein
MTYRWSTPALLGPWFATADEALSHALHRGQAVRDPGANGANGAIVLRPFATLEVSEPGPPAERRAGA